MNSEMKIKYVILFLTMFVISINSLMMESEKNVKNSLFKKIDDSTRWKSYYGL